MKKLIPAICLLLVSAVMLGTSTFAWFSMNTSVTATGMQVVAKSDNTYLLVSATNTTASTIQTENVTTAALTVESAAAKVYPCKPKAASEIGDGKIFETGTAVTNQTTASAYANWYKANAAAPSASDLKAGTATELTTFTGYVIQKTLYLTVAQGANQANNLSVTATFTAQNSKNIAAARVLVATDDSGFAILTPNSATADIKGSNTNITDTTVRTVYVYIYIDGSDSTIYTNNAANLDGANIGLAFNVDAVPAA